jgi:hypothetical protein
MLRSRMGTYDIKGKPISWDAIVIFQLKNGKIAEEWVSRDELGHCWLRGFLSRTKLGCATPTSPQP